MICPACGSENHGVVKTQRHGGFVRRRRACLDCGARWYTREREEREGIAIFPAETADEEPENEKTGYM